MAISFVAQGGVATGANPTVNVPAGLQAFDLLLIVTTGTATPTTPTGWTQVSAQGAGRFITVLYKITTTGTESAVSLTLAGTSSKAVMLAYRGSGNYDVVSTYATGTSTSPATVSQTTRLNNDFVLSIYACTTVTATWTAPASTTSRFSSGSSAGINGMLIVDESKATAGATTVRTATLSTSVSWAAVSVSIREPQTLYWTGTGNWSSTTLWKTSSGGATTIGAPTQNDNVVFDGNSTSCTINSASACTDITLTSAFGGTVAGTSSLSIAGSYSEDVSTGFTWSYTGAVTFVATTTGKTLTTNAGTFVAFLDNAVTFNGIGGGWTLYGGMGGQTKALTLTAGALDLNDQILSFTTFTASGSAVRSLNSGPTQASIIYLSANSGTVLTLNGTNITVTGSITYECQISSASAVGRTIDLNTVYTESNAPSLTVYSSSDTVTLTAPTVKNLYFLQSGLGTGSTIANSARGIYGGLSINGGFTFTGGTSAWTFASTSVVVNQITTTGTALNFPITFSGSGGSWQLLDAMTVGSTRTVTLTIGTLDLNNNNLTCGIFASSNSNTRTLAFGTGQIYVTATNTANTYATSPSTNLTITGTPVVNVTGAGTAGQTRSVATGTATTYPSINFTAGADTVSIQAGSLINSLNFTGFTGTFSNTAFSVYGDLTISAGMTLTAGTSAITFAATSGTKTITSNGNTLDFPITLDGVGGTWQLVGALTMGATRALTLTNGTFNLNNNNVTCGAFSSNNANTRTLTVGTGQFYVTGNSTSVWRTDNAVGLTYTSIPTVNATYSGATGTRTIVNTTASGTYSTAINLNVTAGTDILAFGSAGAMYNNVNFTGYSGAAAFFGFITGNVTYSSTMTNSSTGTLYFVKNTGTQTITSNGITVDNPVNVGYNVSSTAATGDGTTATLTIGSSGNYLFPVGSTITVTGITPTGYNGNYTVTASTLTSVSYANTTTAPQTVAGRIGATGTTVQLQDALTVGTTRAVSPACGYLDLQTYNLTTGTFTGGSNALPRGIITTGGAIYLTGSSATIWNTPYDAVATQTGTVNVYCTYSGATGTRTIVGATVINKTANFYVTAGTDTFTVTSGRSYTSLNFTGFGGILSWAGTAGASVSLYGSFVGPSVAGASVTATSSYTLLFNNGSPSSTFTGNGLTYDMPMSIAYNTPGTSLTCTDALTLGATNGTLTLSGQATLNLKDGVTSTVGSFITSGTGLKYLRSTTAGVQATLSKASGTVTVTYLDIQDSNATGGATWDATAATNVNNGNNTGWLFSGGALTASIIEALASADVVASQVSYNGVAVEGFSAADTESALAVFSRSIVENSVLADTQSFATVLVVSVTEALTSASTQTAARILYDASVEASTLADTQVTAAVFNSARTEASTLNDTQTASAVFTVSRAEGSTLASTENTSIVLVASIVEALQAAGIQATITVQTASLVESSTLTSAQTGQATFLSTRVENSTLADIESVVAAYNATRTENSALASAQASQATVSAAVVENTNLADIAAAQAAFNAAVAEATSINDLVDAVKALAATITENSDIADDSSVYLIVSSEVIESLASADLSSARADFNSISTENMVLSDQLVGYGWFRIVDDQTAVWTNVNNTQSITWTNVGNDQNPNWVQINDTQP